MDEKDWEILLRGRRKSSYQKRRTCVSCDKAICDANRSGYCKRCINQIRYHGNRRRKIQNKTEGTEHQQLKTIAALFLTKLGCTEIRFEVMVGDRRRTPNITVRIDVLGFKGKQRIAVECGGSLMYKLGRAASLVDKVYILPYGETRPYEWKTSIKVCNHCGHRVGIIAKTGD